MSLYYLILWIKWIFFINTSKRIMSICASGRGFTVVQHSIEKNCTLFLKALWQSNKIWVVVFFLHIFEVYMYVDSVLKLSTVFFCQKPFAEEILWRSGMLANVTYYLRVEPSIVIISEHNFINIRVTDSVCNEQYMLLWGGVLKWGGGISFNTLYWINPWRMERHM